MAAPNQISDRALALSEGGPDDRDKSVAELISLAGQASGPLEVARDVLVRRIRIRSDDFPASSALSLVNAALGQVGWADPVEWQPRKWRLPR
ncbi:MAG: hypothetical protein M3N98_03480 [Actinomycetota bacterium]|nr:hypothetical protein [Actinomycetota bacterium]